MKKIILLLFICSFLGCAPKDCAYGSENCECEPVAYIDGLPGETETLYKCREKL